MADSTVPFERVLAPIPPGTRKDNAYDPDGSGRDYAYEYEDIEKARRVLEDVEMRGDGHDSKRQGTRRDPKPAEWDKVFAIGIKVLTTESKDLKIAAWVVEALGHLRGFGGLRDGFAMFRRLQGRYWNSSYPRSVEEPEARRGPYQFLDNERNLPRLIRNIPLTFPIGGVPLSYLHRKEAERNEENAKDPNDPARQLEDGGQGRPGANLRLKDWLAAIDLTPPPEFHRLAREVAACLISFKAWEEATDYRSGSLKHAPSLSRIGEALLDCAQQVVEILPEPDRPESRALGLAIGRSQGIRRPAYVEPVAVNDPGPDLDDRVASPPELPVARGEEARPEPEARLNPNDEPNARDTDGKPSLPPIAPMGQGEASPPEDAESAYRHVRQAAAFLRAADPDDPVPYLLVRSLQLGATFGPGPGEPHVGPPRETRKELRHLVAEGAWEAVVELAEEILAMPEGRGWLDAHRMAIRGLEETGRVRASAACRGLLTAVLSQAPSLLESDLDDGTAAANPETRAWLASLMRVAEEPDRPVVDLDDDPASPPLGSIDRAEASLRIGRVKEAIAAFSDALDAGPGERARYLVTVRFAGACLEEGLDRLALSLLQGLESRPDEIILGPWEGRAFFQEAATMLHDLLIRIDDGTSPDRLARSHARLARLAPADALRRLAGGEPG